MSGHGRSWRRRGAGAAANLALLATVSGVVTYAVAAEGYSTHKAELNDGGIWVTNSQNGYYGRINKPIGQQDAATFATLGDELDVVQDGPVVVGVEGTGRRLRPIDPATAKAAEEVGAALPRSAQVQLAGGTLAVLDVAGGSVRATRIVADAGTPDLQPVDVNSSRLARIGVPAALTVTPGGAVYAASSADDTLTRLAPAGDGFTTPTQTRLDVPVGPGIALTSVGETPVVLDTRTGDLFAQGGVRAVVAPGAVLQQPGPAAADVLVATGESLVSVDLATGELTTLPAGTNGRPSAPVRLGACAYGAWSGGRGAVLTQCGTDDPRTAFLNGAATDLVFRVNRGQIVLNDRFSGTVWDIQLDKPRTLDDWPSFSQRDNEDADTKDDKVTQEGDRRPPKAEPDQFGARAGRTTVLHPLDNDSAPAGRVLAIRSVEAVSRNGAKVTIGPDGQTVQLWLPPRTTAPTSFEYFMDDGRQISDHATVTVATRRDAANQPPAVREGFEPRVWSVPAGGALELPVLPDWRDLRDGDPLVVAGASVKGGDVGATARATASGRLRFSAPERPGPVTVAYAVTDGRSEPVTSEVTFAVQDPDRDRAVAAVAEADIASVEVGRWVTLRPLANDLPGSDPLAPRAQLELAGQIAPVAGAQVRTDVAAGTVSFRATTPRTYSLEYHAAYGDAPLARGRIRVDVRPRERRGPVAMPDTATLFGTAPGLVDVLANDVDPAGGMLVVQGARSAQPEQLDVAVVDGRWVRVSAREGVLRPSPQVVRYTISNGGPAVTGEITVYQRPTPDDNAPVTVDDQVTVRAGASVAIPVLDNDVSPSGDSLSLVADVVGERAGQLTVTAPDGATTQVGGATVSGRLVRYVAPAGLETEQVFRVAYVAANTRGDTAAGEVQVSVIPANRPNGPPEPPLIEGRVVAGGTLVLKLPGAGVDPDGDAVSLVGLASAPQLGRVVKLGANTIEYQAYPGGTGTDEFEFLVTDPEGLQGVGTVRVAVAPVGQPQPPLAVADTLTVEPGRVATVDPLANDLVAPGASPVIELVSPPPGVRLESETGPVSIQAPGGAGGRSLDVVYRLSNGLDTTQATITLRTATPYNNPPVVFDAYGAATDSSAVRVDVLRSAYDPDGPSDRLRVTAVYAPPGVGARVAGGRITVTRGALPLVVPFRVEDADGGAAVGQLYVPPTGTNLPYVKPGALISLESGQTVRARLSDYIVNPSGGPLRLSTGALVGGSPVARVNAVAAGSGAVSVTSAREYAGPGAVAVEIVDSFDENAAGAHRVLLTIPVQVGSSRPTLACPTEPVEVPQGGQVEIDVKSLCGAYSPSLADTDSLVFTADWERDVDGLKIIDPSGSTIVVAADGAVRAGSEGIMLVRTGGSEPGRIRVRVTDAPPPLLSPIRISDLRAGESRVVDLAPYLTPGVPRPVPTVVRASQITGLDVQVVPAGGSSVRITSGARVDGQAQFRVVMSDVASTADDARQATNILSVELLDVPDAPAAPVPGSSAQSGSVRLTWRAPDANGAQIVSYEVKASNGRTQGCQSTSCEISGLTNGKFYTFVVRARNAIGWSPFSPPSKSARPDEKPGLVGPIRMIKQADGALSIAWTRPTSTTSPIDKYRVVWEGGRAEPTSLSIVASGLTNNRPYRFTVYAHNAQGWGPGRTGGPFRSVGPPGRPEAPTITEGPPGANDTATLAVTWPPVASNGPDPVSYTLLHNGFPQPGCLAIALPRCTITGVPYNGRTHTFSVIARTGRDLASPGDESRWEAVAAPLPWGNWTLEATGTDNQAKVSFTVPASRGSTSDVTMLVEGEGPIRLPDTRGSVTRTFSVGDNNGPHRVVLRLCNEESCVDSSPQEVQTYGPLVAAHLQSITSKVTGTEVEWEVTVDANGAPVTVTIESQGSSRPTQTFSLTEVDISRVSTGPLDLGYSASERVTVTLFDNSSRDRGPIMKRDVVTTPDPPDPVVTVSRARKCSDEPGSSADPCHPPGAGEDCLDASCGFVGIEVRHFFSPVTCTVSFQGTPGSTDVGPFADDADHETRLYFGTPGDWVKAACTDDTGNRQASDKYFWPN